MVVRAVVVPRLLDLTKLILGIIACFVGVGLPALVAVRLPHLLVLLRIQCQLELLGQLGQLVALRRLGVKFRFVSVKHSDPVTLGDPRARVTPQQVENRRNQDKAKKQQKRKAALRKGKEQTKTEAQGSKANK